jgi:glycosyltransferase involved in cell wall biosynthesis
MNSALCLIVKNEVRDLAECVIHYTNLGFDRIILYDNGSIDGTAELARELEQVLPIDFLPWPSIEGVNSQIQAYNDCIQCYKNCYDWIAFFDIDELLIPSGERVLPDLLEEFGKESGFVINWLMFGSSGTAKPVDLMMKDYIRRAPEKFPPNRNVKSIIRPYDVVKPCDNPHWFSLNGPLVNLLHSNVIWTPAQPGIVEIESIVQTHWRLHHYYTRSKWHWSKRIARGQAGGTTLGWETFQDHDRNDMFDSSALPFAQKVNDKIVELGLKELLQDFYSELPVY